VNEQQPNRANKTSRYLGLAFQFLASIAVSLWLGWWVDGKTGWTIPVFTMVLPILVIVGMLVKIIRETGPGKKSS